MRETAVAPVQHLQANELVHVPGQSPKPEFTQWRLDGAQVGHGQARGQRHDAGYNVPHVVQYPVLSLIELPLKPTYKGVPRMREELRMRHGNGAFGERLIQVARTDASLRKS